MEFLTLFCLFSVVHRFGWFWMGSFHKNIQVMQQFLQAPFVILHLSYFTLTTFFIILSVTLLSMLMILLSTLSVIKHLICGNNQNWLLSLNLIYKTYGLGQEVTCSFQCSKYSAGFASWSNNTGAIAVKMDGPVFEKTPSSKLLGLICSSKLDWGSYIISVAKSVSKKIVSLIRSMKFISPEVALYIYNSTIWPCMEYCCHVWAGALS